MSDVNKSAVVDTRLWCLHHIGADELHPAPDFATAQKWADWANRAFAKHADISRFVVAVWPWSDSAEEHAAGLEKSIADWTVPEQGSQSAVTPTDREAARMADLLTKAVGDITAALTLAGKQDKIAKWTSPYVEALNALDAIAAMPATQTDQDKLISDWYPRIGEEVRASEQLAASWPDWRDVPLWVVGVTLDRNLAGTANKALNVWVSDDWPVTNRTGGFTDGFYINRDHEADDLVPLTRARQIGGDV